MYPSYVKWDKNTLKVLMRDEWRTNQQKGV